MWTSSSNLVITELYISSAWNNSFLYTTTSVHVKTLIHFSICDSKQESFCNAVIIQVAPEDAIQEIAYCNRNSFWFLKDTYHIHHRNCTRIHIFCQLSLVVCVFVARDECTCNKIVYVWQDQLSIPECTVQVKKI